MGFSADPGAVAASAIVATAGLWWFSMIMKNLKRSPPATRLGIYVLVWLAYFVLMMILAERISAPA